MLSWAQVLVARSGSDQVTRGRRQWREPAARLSCVRHVAWFPRNDQTRSLGFRDWRLGLTADGYRLWALGGMSRGGLVCLATEIRDMLATQTPGMEHQEHHCLANFSQARSEPAHDPVGSGTHPSSTRNLIFGPISRREQKFWVSTKHGTGRRRSRMERV